MVTQLYFVNKSLLLKIDLQAADTILGKTTSRMLNLILILLLASTVLGTKRNLVPLQDLDALSFETILSHLGPLDIISLSQTSRELREKTAPFLGVHKDCGPHGLSLVSLAAARQMKTRDLDPRCKAYGPNILPIFCISYKCMRKLNEISVDRFEKSEHISNVILGYPIELVNQERPVDFDDTQRRFFDRVNALPNIQQVVISSAFFQMSNHDNLYRQVSLLDKNGLRSVTLFQISQESLNDISSLFPNNSVPDLTMAGIPGKGRLDVIPLLKTQTDIDSLKLCSQTTQFMPVFGFYRDHPDAAAKIQEFRVPIRYTSMISRSNPFTMLDTLYVECSSDRMTASNNEFRDIKVEKLFFTEVNLSLFRISELPGTVKLLHFHIASGEESDYARFSTNVANILDSGSVVDLSILIRPSENSALRSFATPLNFLARGSALESFAYHGYFKSPAETGQLGDHNVRQLIELLESENQLQEIRLQFFDGMREADYHSFMVHLFKAISGSPLLRSIKVETQVYYSVPTEASLRLLTQVDHILENIQRQGRDLIINGLTIAEKRNSIQWTIQSRFSSLAFDDDDDGFYNDVYIEF